MNSLTYIPGEMCVLELMISISHVNLSIFIPYYLFLIIPMKSPTFIPYYTSELTNLYFLCSQGGVSVLHITFNIYITFIFTKLYFLIYLCNHQLLFLIIGINEAKQPGWRYCVYKNL